jgi:hypothetical protein
MTPEIPHKDAYQQLATMKVSITDPHTEVQARDYLTKVRTALRRLETDTKALKQPHLASLRAIDAAAKPYKDLLTQRDEDMEQAILAYQRKVREEAQQAQAKLMERYEKKVDKATTKAIMDGKPMPMVLPPQVIATPAKTVKTEDAQQTTVKRKSWRLPPLIYSDGSIASSPEDPGDFTAADNAMFSLGIPLQYFTLDKGAITKIIKAGGYIPGIQWYEEESIAVKVEGGNHD